MISDYLLMIGSISPDKIPIRLILSIRYEQYTIEYSLSDVIWGDRESPSSLTLRSSQLTTIKLFQCDKFWCLIQLLARLSSSDSTMWGFGSFIEDNIIELIN